MPVFISFFRKNDTCTQGRSQGFFCGLFGDFLGGILEYSGVFWGILGKDGSAPACTPVFFFLFFFGDVA
jgi:hypothetical protein